MKARIACLLAMLMLLTGCAARREATTTPMTVTERTTVRPAATVTTTMTATVTQTAPDLPSVFEQADETGDHPISVYVVEEKKIVDMPVEEYLCGVVAGEMRNDWPEEALKAQAVVARTFLLYFLNKNGGSMYEGADISTDVAECQAYDAAGVNDAVKKAVADTRGMALVYGGKYINAWFHACAGGKTATATEGLNYQGDNPPYIQVVDSPEEDAPEDAARWEEAFSAGEVENALEKLDINAEVTSVSITKRGPSGRCTQLEIGGKLVPCVELRMQLDPTRFRSTQLTGISLEDGYLIVSGKGFGHGVGMSQWGAHTLANQGKGYEEILSHYYVGTELTRAWE